VVGHLVLGYDAFEFFFRKVKNFGCQGFVGVDISVQGGVPDIGSDILVVVVATAIATATAIVTEFDSVVLVVWICTGRLSFCGGGFAPFFPVAIRSAIVPDGFGIAVVPSVLFSVPFLPFDVPVSFANKLGKDHVESLVSSPCPRKVPEGRSRHARQYQNFHPYQLSFPSLQLGGGVVDRKHPPGPAFFVAVPRRGLECIKAVLEMDNEWEFPCVVGRIGIVGMVITIVAADKIETVRKNLVVDTESLRGRRNIRVGHLWNGSRHSFHGLEMGLAHLVEISLGLLRASLHLAGFGLGTVALAEALRLDDAVAAFFAAVPAFVF
jgi:hypothetical protein